MCTFGVLGLTCETPAAPKPPGCFTPQPEMMVLLKVVFTVQEMRKKLVVKRGCKRREWVFWLKFKLVFVRAGQELFQLANL